MPCRRHRPWRNPDRHDLAPPARNAEPCLRPPGTTLALLQNKSARSANGQHSRALSAPTNPGCPPDGGVGILLEILTAIVGLGVAQLTLGGREGIFARSHRYGDAVFYGRRPPRRCCQR